MLFNSIAYLIFLPIVFTIYWLNSGKLRYQNLLLLGASYFFYACWDWRFLFLLCFSTLLDYYTGLRIAAAEKNSVRKTWFWLSIVINLGFLGIFKYYDFFAVSLVEALSHIGLTVSIPLLKIILPIGISFYTFHGLSYVIDIYKQRIGPEKNMVDYALFVSYFPLLVAGPIERATHLLPQLKKERPFDYHEAVDGIRQGCWGLFKKIVIADTCAQYANAIFNGYETMDSLSLVLGAVYFAFQIYGDFSGYSDIALGTSRLFGIRLLRNFNYPYFSRDIAEFWRRWHISLSSWFKDYVYIPLGGNRTSIWKSVRNTFIIFLISGIWHGANWTYAAWGLVNALYFIPLLLTGRNRNHIEIVAHDRKWPNLKEVLQMFCTFVLTCIAWIFFRSENLEQAFGYLERLFELHCSGIQYLEIERYSIEIIPLLLCFIALEWTCRKQEHPLSGRFGFARIVLLLAAIVILGVFSNPVDFIYFQF